MPAYSIEQPTHARLGNNPIVNAASDIAYYDRENLTAAVLDSNHSLDDATTVYCNDLLRRAESYKECQAQASARCATQCADPASDDPACEEACAEAQAPCDTTCMDQFGKPVTCQLDPKAFTDFAEKEYKFNRGRGTLAERCNAAIPLFSATSSVLADDPPPPTCDVDADERVRQTEAEMTLLRAEHDEYLDKAMKHAAAEADARAKAERLQGDLAAAGKELEETRLEGEEKITVLQDAVSNAKRATSTFNKAVTVTAFVTVLVLCYGLYRVVHLAFGAMELGNQVPNQVRDAGVKMQKRAYCTGDTPMEEDVGVITKATFFHVGGQERKYERNPWFNKKIASKMKQGADAVPQPNQEEPPEAWASTMEAEYIYK